MSRLLCLALGVVLAGHAADAAERPGAQGHIYGAVETDAGRTYTGLLRWGTEEAFWDDLFQSTKEDLPFLEEHGDKNQRRDRLTIFGITVGYRWNDADDSSRMFIARFGDLQRIEVLRGERIRATLKGGATIELEGGSNDIGGEVQVLDDTLGQVDLEWDNIRSISFRAAPTTIHNPVRRLFGKVRTDTGSFEGYVQWDSQECLATDKLDGDTDDGGLSIEMGKIAAIEKHDRRGSEVELVDGRKFVLENSNDVDSDLRGIFVEDPRYGRVKISWDAFERVDFKAVETTGRGYGDYAPARELAGTVTDQEGKAHRGRLVFDLDEEGGWELLNGNRDDVEYYIPFSMIRAIEPQRGDAAKVVLRNGEELILEDSQDVSEDNAGVVVIGSDGRERFFSWDDVRKIAFD